MAIQHGHVRPDNLSARKRGGHLAHAVHTADMDNGMVFMAGSNVTDEREMVEVATPTATTLELEPIYLHFSVAIDKTDDHLTNQWSDYYVPAGNGVRGYMLREGDIWTVTTDMIDGTPALDQYVVPTVDSLKLVPSTDGTVVHNATTYKPRFVGKVFEETTLGWDNRPAVAIRVVKN